MGCTIHNYYYWGEGAQGPLKWHEKSQIQYEVAS